MAEGEDFVGYYLIKELEVKQTNATPPKDFLDLVLADATGQISAKYWEVSAAEKGTFHPMCLVKVKGIVQTYRERLQVKVVRIRKTTEEDSVSMTDFIRCAPLDPEDLRQVIVRAAADIGDSRIRAIVEYCVGKVQEKLLHAPAAKMHHHAYYAGLAYHMVRMLELGEFLCRQRPFLHADLLKAGIILHDIAKPEEMISQYGVVSDYSTHGKLVGHISMAANWIVEAAIHAGIDTASDTVLALQHLVLSHHNLGEWGSPVQPQLAEAVALHYIDTLDAKLQMVEDTLDTTPPGEAWTQPIRGLENKPFYRLKL